MALVKNCMCVKTVNNNLIGKCLREIWIQCLKTIHWDRLQNERGMILIWYGYITSGT
jgi:hypothetical protein